MAINLIFALNNILLGAMLGSLIISRLQMAVERPGLNQLAAAQANFGIGINIYREGIRHSVARRS